MRRSQAANYARWSAAAALLCAALTAAVYLKREYTRHIERRNAPPAAPVNVDRQSTRLTFSKGEATRTIFTVEASKSTDFKGLNASDLEGVKVTIFGKDGDRHDTMETHSCQYSKDSGNFDCAGDVEITLMSKDEWEAMHAGPPAAGREERAGAMKVETHGMTFNRASGEAKTDQHVRFTFASGSGEGVGATYNSDQGALHLLHQVRLKLDQPVSAKAKAANGASGRVSSLNANKEPVDVTGSRLDFDRDAGTLYLSGPAEAHTHSERLTAPAFLLRLDGDFRAKRLVAKRNGQALPEFTAANGNGRQRLSAEEITADFSPQGWVTSAEADGQVSGEAAKDGQTQTAKAENATMEMVPAQNAPKLLVLRHGVDARASVPAPGSNAPDTRRLTTEELRILFAERPDSAGTRLQNAETPVAGRVEWNEAGGSGSKAAQTVIEADQLNLGFDSTGAASRLDAKGNVRTERTVVGGNKQTATANNGFADLEQQGGGWSRMQLNGNVQLNEVARTARADQAVFVHADQSATLTGHAFAKDATSQTSAQKLIFWQDTGEVRAEGNVRSSDLSARGAPVHLAPVASNVTADHLAGNSKTGRARYTGRARLWQGDSVLEADSVELLKNERMLNASGNVRAVFPEAPSSVDAGSPAGASRSALPKAPVLWHARSEKLTYWDAENRAHLWDNVVVEAPDQRMTGPDLELFFTRAAADAQAAGTSRANAPGPALGAEQISRAVGTGGVVVVQGDRRATAERGVYTASDGKFVMSGGTPTLFDAAEGTTVGRQLTFFLADATIIVDSENGSRTLTKHRVEK
jgi:lipopolysaccharide export system protein LptA